MIPRPRVLVTRAAGQASKLADELHRLGAEPVLIPAIETVELGSYDVLDAALRRVATDGAAAFDWAVFTSANAVAAFARRMEVLGLAWPGTVTGPHVAAIGSVTATALERVNVTVTLLPEEAVAESLADALVGKAKKGDGTASRFLLIRAEDGREVLPERLRDAGAEVTVAPAYRTVMPAGSVEAVREVFAREANWPEVVTFTSSSSVRNFFALLEAAGVALRGSSDSRGKRPALVSIGPVTSGTLSELGHPQDAQAAEATVESLAAAVVGYLRRTKGR